LHHRPVFSRPRAATPVRNNVLPRAPSRGPPLLSVADGRALAGCTPGAASISVALFLFTVLYGEPNGTQVLWRSGKPPRRALCCFLGGWLGETAWQGQHGSRSLPPCCLAELPSRRQKPEARRIAIPSLLASRRARCDQPAYCRLNNSVEANA